MKRRILAMLLAVVMLLGTLPVSAFAAEDESADVSTESVAESVEEEAASDEEEEETPADNGEEVSADEEEKATANEEAETSSNEEEEAPASGEDDAADGGQEATSADDAAVQKVIGLIDAIGEVTLASEAAIGEANGAYQLLTAEQKALVTNYDALVDAMAAYMLLSVAMPVEESAAEAEIFVTVNNKGVLAKADDGSVMANRPVTVKDLNEDGILTCDEALTAAHAAYCKDGYATSEGDLGISVTKLWGETQTTNYLFFRNGVPLTMNIGDADSSAVSAGNHLYASINADNTYWADWYTCFDQKSYRAAAGEEFTLTLKGYLGMGSASTPEAVSGVAAGTWDNGSFTAIEGKTTDAEGKVTLSFDTAGTYYVTASGTVKDTVTDWSSGSDGSQTKEVDCPIMAPVCVVTVEAAEVVPADPADITVTIVNKGNVVMARKSITVTDYDADGSLDVDDALYAAHAADYPGGAAAGYSCYTGNYGLSLGTLWGDTSGCFGYRLNDGSCYSLADSVKAGDYLVAYVYQDQTGWSDTYARFGQSTYSATAGEALTVAVDQAAYDENWKDIFVGCDSVALTAYDSSFTALSADVYSVDGFRVTFRNAGTYYLVASGTGGKILVPAVAVVTVKAAYAPLSALKFTNGSKDTSTQYTITPAFDPAVKEYTLTVPDSTASIYAWATLAEGSSDAIKITYTKTNNAAASVAVTSGKTTGTSLSSAVASGKLTGNTLTVMVGDTAAYTIHIVRQATLSKLVVTAAGETVSFDKSFSATAAEYTAKIAHDAVLTVTPTVKSADAAVQIAGAAEDGTVKPVWTADRTFDLTVTVSGEGAVSSTYTIRCQQLASALEIQKAPTKTAYSAGETFDPTGMELKASYVDGGSKTILPEEFTFAPAGSLGLGTTEIEVTYDGLSVVQPITIAAVFEGQGTEASPFLIKTTEDMVKLSELVAAGVSFSGEYLKMVNDITLPDTQGEDAWVPLGTGKAAPFSGNFDGNGKLLTVPEGGLPLIGFPKQATLKNLNIYGTKIAGYGVVNGYAQGDKVQAITIENVTLKSGTQTLKAGFIGGYASGTDTITIRNCTVEAGVVIGYDKQQKWIGSFGGEFNGTIENCVSYATVYGTDFVGGIVADKGQSMGAFSVTGCEFHGTVEASGNYVGGIVGHGYGGTGWGFANNAACVTIQNCKSTGSITGGNYVGGILGADAGVVQCWVNGTGYIQNNQFTGQVKATAGEYVGGIIGYLKSLNCYNVIENNFYQHDCGAAKGIGYVQYVDTSCETHETASGATYFNTANGKPDIDGVTKTDHNRTDDPLGADAQNLTRTDTAPAAVKLTVSGSYKTEYTVGEKLDLTGMVLTITYDDGSAKEVPVSEAEITGFDSKTPGEKTLLIKHSNLSTSIKVTVKKAVETIDVTITVLGDAAHGGGGSVHTYAGGGLSTWVGAATYTVDSNATVWTVLKKCLDDHGLSYSKGSNYVVSINGLAEFTNGSSSGWMYTLNGDYPLLGIDEQHLEDGDVIVFHYTDDYTKERHGYTEEEDSTAVDVAEKLISNIGTVTLSTICKNKIDAARKAYDALTFIEKKQVSNYAVLEAAEAAYAKLKKENDEKKATEVEQLINQIDSQITLNSEKAIKAARTAYEKLTADQKALVDNLYKLTNAERELAKLKATDEDKQKAQEVMDKIEDLGEITSDSQEAIEAARAAYDKLTDIQKALVENYQILEDAEEKLALLQAAAVGEDIYKTTGDYMESLGAPTVGTVGGEWMVIGLARSGRSIPDAYYDSVVAYVLENIDEQERLHTAKSTENSRLILALTAIGKDVTDVRGHNLLTGLNDMDYVRYQGINGPIWALIALDSGNYPVPEGNVTREGLLDVILDAQLEDGGWALSGEDADADMTGMALQALAPYCESRGDVKKAVENALEALSLMQNADGSYAGVDGASSESIAQVIVGLTALGIDPDTDERFLKNGTSALDALLAYYVEGGGFKHILSGNRDGMATEQAYYALTAYYRMLSGKTGLYDMTDIVDMGGDAAAEPVETTEPVPATEPVEEEPSGGFPWFLAVVILAAGAAAAVLVPVVKKKRFLK